MFKWKSYKTLSTRNRQSFLTQSHAVTRNILRVIGAESNRSLVTASVMLTGSNNFVTRLVLPRRQAPGFISRIYEWSAARLSRPQQSEAIYKLIGYDDSLRALLSHLGPPPSPSHLLLAEFISFGPRTRPSNWLVCLSLFRSCSLSKIIRAYTVEKDTKTFRKRGTWSMLVLLNSIDYRNK